VFFKEAYESFFFCSDSQLNMSVTLKCVNSGLKRLTTLSAGNGPMMVEGRENGGCNQSRRDTEMLSWYYHWTPANGKTFKCLSVD
jgi:hypothetical protein